jgi:hypothetical protein
MNTIPRMQELDTMKKDRTFGDVIESVTGSVGRMMHDANGPAISASLALNVAMVQQVMK